MKNAGSGINLGVRITIHFARHSAGAFQGIKDRITDSLERSVSFAVLSSHVK